jgi:hypothetical protein
MAVNNGIGATWVNSASFIEKGHSAFGVLLVEAARKVKVIRSVYERIVNLCSIDSYSTHHISVLLIQLPILR